MNDTDKGLPNGYSLANALRSEGFEAQAFIRLDEPGLYTIVAYDKMRRRMRRETIVRHGVRLGIYSKPKRTPTPEAAR